MPLTNYSEHKLNNTLEIKEFLEKHPLPPGHCLASLDVKSLFTCIPHDFAINAMKIALQNSNFISSTTLLNSDEILRLVQICLSSTTIQWNNKIYSQITGTPMGSPISVVVAGLSMQFLEDQLIQNSSYPLHFWKRYVDDILIGIPEHKLIYFIVNLNNISSVKSYTDEIAFIEGYRTFFGHHRYQYILIPLP